MPDPIVCLPAYPVESLPVEVGEKPDGAVQVEGSGPDPLVWDVLRRLDAGELRGDRLAPDLRHRCVEHLTAEGFTNGEIGRRLGIHERTVRRDRQTIRGQDPLTPGLALGDELLGEYERYTMDSMARLTRLSRDPTTPPYARLWAEDAASRIYQRFVDTARRMEYFEAGARRVRIQRITDPAERRRDLLGRAAERESMGLSPDPAIVRALGKLSRKSRGRGNGSTRCTDHRGETGERR